ncbi:MAG: TonB-dependent receptor plug domain-containing protein, partial [Acidobacteriota bacterium]
MIFNKDSRQQSQRSHVRKLGGGAALMIFTVLVLLNTVSVSAQKTHFDRSSEVIIHVKDSDGIPISGAVVKNLNDGTEKITNENGIVHFPAGVKAITIAATNFDSIQIKQIDLQEVQVILFPRQIAETVYVRSASMAGSDGALEDMPGAVSRLDQSDFTKTAVVDFGGALRKVPGVHVKDEEGLGLRPNIGIRGSNPTRSTKVLLLEDGLPLTYAPYGDNASYYHPPIERFEAIEVVKGSGQIEYGPVTVVGVINYMTPNPTDNLEGTLRLSSGTRDYLMGDALLTGRLGAFGFVGSVNRKQGEGARMNTRTGLTDSLFKVTRNIGSRGYVAIKATALRERSQVTYSGLTEDEFRIDPRGNLFINDKFYGDREGLSSALSLAPTPRTSLSANIYLNRFSRDWWRQSSNS